MCTSSHSLNTLTPAYKYSYSFVSFASYPNSYTSSFVSLKEQRINFGDRRKEQKNDDRINSGDCNKMINFLENHNDNRNKMINFLQNHNAPADEKDEYDLYLGGSTLRLAPPSPLPADSMSSSALSSNSFEGSTLPTLNQTVPEMTVIPINATACRSRETLTIAPPYPWATNVCEKIHSLEYLESNHITTITGKVQCQHCEIVYQVSYNVRERFEVVKNIFAVKKEAMRERAPDEWKTPEATKCEICGHEKVVKPVIAEDESQINWLFLLLGQTLGHCKMGHLKYFCKHSKSHCSGAKDRILYLTYLGLCKMLQPNNPLFDRD